MRHRCFDFFLIILLIPLVFRESFAVPFFSRILAQVDVDRSHTKPAIDQIAPSPGPSAAVNPGDNGRRVPRNQPSDGEGVAENGCSKVLRRCSIDQLNITACIPHAAKGPQESKLIVENNGENLLEFNVTFSPKKKIYQNQTVSEHKVKQINISSDIEGSSSVMLSAANWTCIIPMGASVPAGSFYIPPNMIRVTPIYGAYFLAMVGLILGGTFFCCKFWKKERHLDGVPYRELQLGEQGHVSPPKVESATGWDEDWDDDWDEEKAVKSPGPKRLANRVNGNSTSSRDADQWGKDWDD